MQKRLLDSWGREVTGNKEQEQLGDELEAIMVCMQYVWKCLIKTLYFSNLNFLIKGRMCVLETKQTNP